MRSVTRNIVVALAVILCTWVGSALGQRSAQVDRLKAEAVRQATAGRILHADVISARTIVVQSPDGDRAIILKADNNRATVQIVGPEGQVFLRVAHDRRGLSVHGKNEGLEIVAGTKTGGAPSVITYEMGGEREEHFGVEPLKTLRSIPKPRAEAKPLTPEERRTYFGKEWANSPPGSLRPGDPRDTIIPAGD
jgi:hypothetical protein